jgi:protein O-GlcNAc transferase
MGGGMVEMPSDPGAASAAHGKALELLERGEAALAVGELRRAAELDPGNPKYLNTLGNACKAAGDTEGAIAGYRRALELAADFLPALYNLGLVLRESGRLEEAEGYFRRVASLDASDADALFHLGSLLAGRGRFAEAEETYRAALALSPGNPYLWMNLGTTQRELPGRAEEAARSLGQCVALKPEFADGHYHLGLALKKLGRSGEAIDSHRKALRLDPRSHKAHNALGNILQDEGRLDEALAHYREAIELAPGYATAHNNLGTALVRKGLLDDAALRFRKAIELDPDFADAHLNLGTVSSQQGRRDEALRAYENALRLQPDSAAIRECMLYEMQQVCDWSRLDELCAFQRESVFSRPHEAISPFSLLLIRSTPEEQLQCARNYSAHLERAVARERGRLDFRFDRRPGPKLRIGYLSGDFHDHPAAYLVAELIELHDRGRFEIAAYSYGPDDGSAIRARLARAFDRFVDLSALSHADAASRIHGDGTDILLDLTGYTSRARAEILALRPAPVQVNFLGYPGTMGAGFIDYLISNRFMTPASHAAHFSEKLVLLPGSHQVNDRKRAVAETPPRVKLGLPEKAFVFCCLNQTNKILPDIFATWMRLLLGTPGSVLWLVDNGSLATGNLRVEAEKRGVPPKRLVFAPRVPIAEHLARLRAADLFLDTLPYNAHSTTSDALWVGLPVLTCVGDTFTSRMGGSMLKLIGLPELITHCLADYEALALRLARNPDELAGLRERLARNRATTPLYDTPAYARHLEAACLVMWENHLAGAARDIVMPAQSC